MLAFEDWAKAPRFNNTPSLWGNYKPKGIAVHWQGSDLNIINKTVAQETARLNAILRDHLNRINPKTGRKVYATVAYNVFIFGESGRVYEARGRKYKSGAQGKGNDTHLAVCFIVDKDLKISDAAINSFIKLRREWIATGVGLEVKPHGQHFGNTNCPGDYIRSVIRHLDGKDAAPPKPPKPIKGLTVRDIKSYLITISTDDQGNGWTHIPNLKWGRDPIVVGYSINGSNPAKEGYWKWHADIKAQAHAGGVIVSATSAPPKARFDVWVTLGRP